MDILGDFRSSVRVGVWGHLEVTGWRHLEWLQFRISGISPYLKAAVATINVSWSSSRISRTASAVLVTAHQPAGEAAADQQLLQFQ